MDSYELVFFLKASLQQEKAEGIVISKKKLEKKKQLKQSQPPSEEIKAYKKKNKIRDTETRIYKELDLSNPRTLEKATNPQKTQQ